MKMQAQNLQNPTDMSDQVVEKTTLESAETVTPTSLADMVSGWWDALVNGGPVVDLKEFGIALSILLVFVLTRKPFARLIVGRLKALAAKTKWRGDDLIAEALEAPLRYIPVLVGLFFAIGSLDLSGEVAKAVYNFERSLVVLVLFWALYRLVEPTMHVFTRLEKLFSKALVQWLNKLLKIGIVLIGAAAVLELWGIKVGPILAGLGLFGVAVALGAQDVFKNLIAGLTIIAEKRMNPGDWIKVEGVVEGTVENIGFRSTQIRRFDRAPVHVPNAQLADSALTNFSNMTHRRIYWKIGVEYRTTVEQLQRIRDGIADYIEQNDAFAKTEDGAYFLVFIDSFNASSIDIMVYCFTKTTVWAEWLEIKQNLAYKIKDIVEKAGTGFAFPSQSVYVESLPGTNGDQAEVFVPPSGKASAARQNKAS